MRDFCMKVDLHCHTKKVKSGEVETRNVTPQKFAEKIRNANVEIVAITNHNSFDLAQYTELSEKVNSYCQVWPGVEIDIKSSGDKKWHLIIVGNPNNVATFNTAVQELFASEIIESCALDIKSVINQLSSCDTIYIPHFHKKPAIPEEDLEQLKQLVKDDSRVFNEPSDMRTMGVYTNHNFSMIIGSDIQDWEEYEKSNFSELRLPISSFEQFCMLAKRDQHVVKTLLDQKNSHQVIASPHHSSRFKVTLYEDVNVIFGQKGTGKSEILKSIYNELTNKGLKCTKYCGTEKDDDFEALMKTKDMRRDVTKVDSVLCEAEFEFLAKWSDKNPALFTKYVNWYQTKDNNLNKRSMKITNAVNLPHASKIEYNIVRDELASLSEIKTEKKSIRIEKYLEEVEISEFEKYLDKLTKSIKDELISEFVLINSVRLTNFSLEHIKKAADNNTDTVSKPSSTGFYEFAMDRLALRQNVQRILVNITKKEISEKNELGTLEDKGKIYIKRVYRMLCENSRTHEFDVGIRILSDIKKMLEVILDNFYMLDLSANITALSEKCKESTIKSTSKFLGLSKIIVQENDQEYSPSNGERAILLLEQILRLDADAYLLDEPELGMGNSYVDSQIRPQLSALGKQRKVVVIATHNANIAVRTLPYVSIFRDHQNGKYYTYIGNPFRDKLINIDDESDTRNWTEESMHTLEGGRDAFYERKAIYETGKN